MPQLLIDLGAHVRKAVADSAAVNSALDQIRARGYEPVLQVETSVTSRSSVGRETETEMGVAVQRSRERIETAMTPLDKEFLRSLKISVE